MLHIYKNNPVQSLVGADKVWSLPFMLLTILGGVALAYGIIVNPNVTIAAFFGAIIGGGFVAYSFFNPNFAFVTALSYSFLVSLIERFAKVYAHLSIPFGLGVDFFFTFALFALILKGFYKANYKNLKNPLVAFAMIYAFYIFMQALNPSSPTILGWIFTIRQYVLYFIFILIVGFVIFNREKDFNTFLLVFFSISILGSLWGIQQLHIGLSKVDAIFIQPKLDRHMLFGKLRVFSIYDNAGQAGASQGHAAVVATILAIYEKRKNWKIFFIITALFTYYGLAISGTRGALAVPIVGMGLYLALSRKIKIQIAGGVTLLFAVFILAFTTIGQSNYTVNRMRTAFNPDDASFQYRLKAREGYADYLSAKPFGWGLGTAGYWGARFLGDKNVMGGTDGGYVQIQAETGIVGIYFYLFLYLGYILRALYIVFKMPDNKYRGHILALASGIAGLLVANYGNSVTFQFPSSIAVAFSMLFIELNIRWYKKIPTPNFLDAKSQIGK